MLSFKGSPYWMAPEVSFRVPLTLYPSTSHNSSPSSINIVVSMVGFCTNSRLLVNVD